MPSLPSYIPIANYWRYYAHLLAFVFVFLTVDSPAGGRPGSKVTTSSPRRRPMSWHARGDPPACPPPCADGGRVSQCPGRAGDRHAPGRAPAAGCCRRRDARSSVAVDARSHTRRPSGHRPALSPPPAPPPPRVRRTRRHVNDRHIIFPPPGLN